MDANGMQVLRQLHKIISGFQDKHILQMTTAVFTSKPGPPAGSTVHLSTVRPVRTVSVL